MRPILLALSLLACNEGGLVSDDSGAVDDTASDSDSATDSDTGSDTGTDTEPPPPPPSTRFVALGDAGTGTEDQKAVADQIAAVCARADRGCDYALYLGDNIYNTGVDGVDDDQFRTKFEEPYAALGFPFYVVLGNHDLGGDGLGIDINPSKAQYEIDYTQHSTKWTMPDKYYVVPESAAPPELVRFYALNTTDIFFGLGATQAEWLEFETLTSTATWDIAFGHHPYVSNGQHGDAGEYEGIPDLGSWSDIPRGAYVQEFIEDQMCGGQIDVYFCGHDHNRQWLGTTSGCTTTFAVSGAGGKVSDFRHDGNATEFQDDQTEGFLWVEIEGDTLTAYFYDKNGTENGPFVVQK